MESSIQLLYLQMPSVDLVPIPIGFWLTVAHTYRGFVFDDESGENLLSWLIIPKYRLTSVMFLGASIRKIALVLSGSGDTP